MAFNVSTKDGKHVGIIYGNAFEAGSFNIGKNNRRIVRVALTTQRIEAGSLDYEQIRKDIAEQHNAKTLLGKIKEENLQQALENYWEDDKRLMKQKEESLSCLYQNYSPSSFDEKFICRMYHLRNRKELRPYWLGEDFDIEGFLLYDLERGALLDDKTLQLEEEWNCFETRETYNGIKPTHFVVAARPEVTIQGVGIGEGLLTGANISDFGGRNHVHSTKLSLLSGNAVLTTEIPLQIHTKKGYPVTMYVKEGKNTAAALLTGDVLYKV